MTTLACSVTDCPFRDGGACLEAFDDPADCPNTSEFDDTDSSGVGEPISEGQDDVETEVEQPISRLVSLQSGDSLGLSQANDLRAKRVCRFVLVAGEVDAGKSTLLVELFGRFLKGPYEGWSFAGSSTLSAFNRVHAPARESSGNEQPLTPRTADEGMQFLHLAISDGSRRDLLLSELSGERFKAVIDGAAVDDLIPIAKVADRCLLLVDGDRMSSTSVRGRLFSRARRLVGGLTEADGLPPGSELLILASKADLWRDSARDEVEAECDSLVDFAQERGLRARWVALAVRPEDATPEVGLAAVLDWMLDSEVETDPTGPNLVVPAGRRYWQDRHE